MTPDESQRCKGIAEDAFARPEADRAAFVEEACRNDAALRREVDPFLQSMMNAGDYFEPPPIAAVPTFPSPPLATTITSRGSDTPDTPDAPTGLVSLSPGASSGLYDTAAMVDTVLPDCIGHYRIVSRLGQGGMGTVYAARDERLDRLVAIEVINRTLDDALSRKRFWREARTAARVNHPNICQLYEIGEHGDSLFLAMELLLGESLADRIRRAPVAFSEAIRISVDMLGALDALHREGVVHRDLKPTNVFLAAHGVKLLDFGLATAAVADSVDAAETIGQLTQHGMIVGTPGYMSPEQLRGHSVDARSDIFAAGAVLFEMLSGRPAFAGQTVIDVLHAVLHEPAPALGGSQAIEAAGIIVQRALAKDPADRYPSTAAMTEALRALHGDTGTADRAHRMSWLIVLPFRALRSDPESEFLAFGLADAITSSLSGLQSLGVRSSAVAARFAGDAPDIDRVAAEAHVDLVLTGTLMRAGLEIRVNTQLVAAPGGTLLWSQTSQVTLRDLFQLQDDLVQRIVSSLTLPLTAREHRLIRHDVPASPTAYEFYLRAIEMSRLGLASVDQIHVARGLLLRSVEDDPRYAPAWARLGRCYRLIGKGGEDPEENLARAESSLRRAIELNPELSMAHNLYAYLEIDLGRSKDALMRLVARAHSNSSDPELFAGLVQACRYCGLLDASAVAHDRARQLDPQIATSIGFTYWLLGDSTRAVEGCPHFFFEAMVLASIGREHEALAILTQCEQAHHPELIRAFLSSLRALLEGKRQESLDATERCIAHFQDPEALFYMARQLAYLGESNRALAVLRDVIGRGYLCSRILARDPWLHSLRSTSAFADILRETMSLEQDVAGAFVRSGGHRLLGMTVAV